MDTHITINSHSEDKILSYTEEHSKKAEVSYFIVQFIFNIRKSMKHKRNCLICNFHIFSALMKVLKKIQVLINKIAKKLTEIFNYFHIVFPQLSLRPRGLQLLVILKLFFKNVFLKN